MKFHDLKVSTRLYGALGIYIFMVVVQILYNFVSLQGYQTITDTIYLKQFKGTDLLIEADRDSYQSNLALAHMLHFAEDGNTEKAQAQLEGVDGNRKQAWDRFHGFVEAGGAELPGAGEHIQDFEQHWKDWDATSKDILAALSQADGGYEAAAEIYYGGAYAGVYDPMRDAMDKLTDISLSHAEAMHQSTLRLFDGTLGFSIGVALFTLLYSAGLFFLLNFMLFRPVGLLGQRINDIGKGEGDLTQSLPVNGNNELGKVAEGYNEFVHGLRNTIQALRENIERNDNLRMHLDEDTGNIASSVTQISANIGSIKAQVEGLENSIETSGRSIMNTNNTMDTLDREVDQQGAALKDVTETLQRMTTHIDEAAQQAEWKKADADALQTQSEEGSTILAHARESVGNIENSLASIREMMGIIANIASQTNLLAMNAAIEAAHAGEAGRGFAVVADEIRNLAENAGKQSKGINTALKKITQDIQTAGAASARSNESFDQIRKRVKHVVSGFTNIRGSVAQLKDLNGTVQSAIGQLEAASAAVSTQSRNSRSGIQSVAREMEQVRTVSRMVNDAMDEINSGTAEIAASMERLRHLAGDLGETSHALDEGIGRFKT